MQKSGIFNFRKLCQKNVGFLLLGVLCWGRPANALVAARYMKFPDQHGCDLRQGMCETLVDVYSGMRVIEEKDDQGVVTSTTYSVTYNGTERTYASVPAMVLAISYQYYLINYDDIADYYNSYVFRNVHYREMVSDFLETGQDCRMLVPELEEAMCPCGAGKYTYVAGTLTSAPLPTCTLCRDGRYRTAEYSNQHLCQTCPAPLDSQTAHTQTGATSIEECYVDSAAIFHDSRGTYRCANDECNYAVPVATQSD